MTLDGGRLRAGGDSILMSGLTLGEGSESEIHVDVNAEGSREYLDIKGVIDSEGGFKDWNSVLELHGKNTYKGDSLFKGALDVYGQLPDETGVVVEDGATLYLAGNDEIGSIEGSGDIVLALINGREPIPHRGRLELKHNLVRQN